MLVLILPRLNVMFCQNVSLCLVDTSFLMRDTAAHPEAPRNLKKATSNIFETKRLTNIIEIASGTRRNRWVSLSFVDR